MFYSYDKNAILFLFLLLREPAPKALNCKLTECFIAHATSLMADLQATLWNIYI